jgi:hypothetical protein
VATFTGLGGSFPVDWVATFTGIRSLKAEKAAMQENIARLDKLKGHIKLSTCGENNRPCVEVETKIAYGDKGSKDRSFFILKGVK